MKLKNPMLVVTDIDKQVEFYKKVFGLHVIMDFGANKTLTGGLALQTVETYEEFIGTNDIFFGGNNFEIYFEEMCIRDSGYEQRYGKDGFMMLIPAPQDLVTGEPNQSAIATVYIEKYD